ncbi:MAG: extracellular solute-binding protein [Turicibacter sp.]|nr:extracellular solute-binding protein [Turicibacter sp.]
MKKFLRLSLFAMLMLVVLVACGNDDADPTTDDEDDATEVADNGEAADFDWRAYEGETVTVGIWGGSDAEVATRPELFEAFYELTGITVEERIYADFLINLQAELIGGIAPDLFYVDSNVFPMLHADGVLENLDGFIADTPDFNQDDFYTPLLNAFSVDGAVYGIPKDFSTLGLFYNVDLLAEAGFTPEDIPDTMAEMPAFLAELAEGLPADVTAGVIQAGLARHLFVYEAAGTPIMDADGFAVLDQEGQLDYMQLLVDSYQAGHLATPAGLGDGWSGDSFGLENVALMIEGNWAVGHLNLQFPDVNWGTRELPTINGNQGSMAFTVSWSMNAASDNQGAAWLFMHFVNGVEGQEIMATGASLLPSRVSVAEEMDIAGDPILAPFQAAAAYATPWQSGINLPIVYSTYGNYFPGALSGDLTLLEAVQRIMEAANNEIETHMQ